jgi:hypothetical protein
LQFAWRSESGVVARAITSAKMHVATKGVWRGTIVGVGEMNGQAIYKISRDGKFSNASVSNVTVAKRCLDQ